MGAFALKESKAGVSAHPPLLPPTTRDTLVSIVFHEVGCMIGKKEKSKQPEQLRKCPEVWNLLGSSSIKTISDPQAEPGCAK